MRKISKEEILELTSRALRHSGTPLGVGALYDAVSALAQERRVTLKQVGNAIATLTASQKVATVWVHFKAKYLWIADKN